MRSESSRVELALMVEMVVRAAAATSARPDMPNNNFFIILMIWID